MKKMANQDMQYIQGPKMDWTEDAGLHQRFKDWREEVELLMDMVLSHIKNADTKIQRPNCPSLSTTKVIFSVFSVC